MHECYQSGLFVIDKNRYTDAFIAKQGSWHV